MCCVCGMCLSVCVFLCVSDYTLVCVCLCVLCVVHLRAFVFVRLC